MSTDQIETVTGSSNVIGTWDVETGIYEPAPALVRNLANQVIQRYGADPTTEDIAEIVEGGDWPGRKQLDDGDIEVLFDEVRDAIGCAELTVSWKR